MRMRMTDLQVCSITKLRVITLLAVSTRLPLSCSAHKLPKYSIQTTVKKKKHFQNPRMSSTLAMVLTYSRSFHQKISPPLSHPNLHENTHSFPTNKLDAGVKIARIGLLTNLGMAIAKGVGGHVFNSQAMIADAWHSLTDMTSDILTLATVSCSSKPPTGRFPTGYGKIESLGALGVSSILLIAGCSMCYHSCEILYSNFILKNALESTVHSHGHTHGLTSIPSLHAVWLALGTILLKEVLYHTTMKIAVIRKSSVLASNAIHHRIDSLTSVVTLFVILGANFLREAHWLDPVGGFIISLLVIKGGWANIMSAIYELVDRGIGEEVKTWIRQNAKKTLGEIRHGSHVELQDVEGLKSGQNYLINLQVAVPPTWSIHTMTEVENELRQALGSKVQGVRRVQVRFVSKEKDTSSFHDEFILRTSNQDLEERLDSHDPSISKDINYKIVDSMEDKH
ncbi:Mitochondrial metal transporter 2 [Golovinomyces cichoracearum]|uniref:Mitochondrial metal transporter 2 n=1 Tax=Golovinomyces cichoracearum TaxID=62708 RepID=A0A420HM06_9PEZI|nr:Mitochondrial metal transporter 2 [Golovinomyces cichoracearum]